MVINIGVILLFLVLAGIFSRGKGAWLISGYNMMPKSEKEKYDEVALCHFMAKFMVALALCWIPVTLYTINYQKVFIITGISAFCLVTVIGLIYANTGNRFKK